MFLFFIIQLVPCVSVCNQTISQQPKHQIYNIYLTYTIICWMGRNKIKLHYDKTDVQLVCCSSHMHAEEDISHTLRAWVFHHSDITSCKKHWQLLRHNTVHELPNSPDGQDILRPHNIQIRHLLNKKNHRDTGTCVHHLKVRLLKLRVVWHI